MSCILSACNNSKLYVKPYPIDCAEEAFAPPESPVITESKLIKDTEIADSENRSRWYVTTLRLRVAQGCLKAAETVGYIKRK